jgi:hypothetical protein
MNQLKSWRKGGTSDFGNWRPGVQVTHINMIAAGNILFQDCEQFDALNLCRVTNVDYTRQICYAKFVNPFNTQEGRIGGGEEHEFAIWEHELTRGQRKYFAAVSDRPNCECLNAPTCCDIRKTQDSILMTAGDSDPASNIEAGCGTPKKTVADLFLAELPLFDGMNLDQEILDMPQDSGCGEDCCNVLRKGHELAALCLDVQAQIIQSVEEQVRIFYYG